MTVQKKVLPIFRSVSQKNDYPENVIASFHLPWVILIHRRGFYYIHEKTINEIDPFNTGLFFKILKYHNLKIHTKNSFKLHKITING